MQFNNNAQSRWHEARVKKGEVVRGGYLVFRRGETTGRIKVSANKLPFEHETREKAMAEAKRLAHENPLVEFCVFQQVGSVIVHGSLEDTALADAGYMPLADYVKDRQPCSE